MFAILLICSSGYGQEIEKVWERFYRSSPDTTTFDNEVTGFVALPDGGFVVSSFYERYVIGPQIWIFRADRDGEIVWELRLDTRFSNRYRNRLMRLNEHELLFTMMDYIEERIQPRLICISNEGEIRWDRVYQSETDEYTYNVTILRDESILLQNVRIYDDSRIYVLTFIDQDGEVIRSRTYSCTGASACQLHDGRLIFNTTHQFDQYRWGPAIFLTDEQGDSLDYFRYQEQLYLRSGGITKTPEGNPLIYNFYGDYNFHPQLIKLNRNFEPLWEGYYDERRQSIFCDLAVKLLCVMTHIVLTTNGRI